MQWFQKSEREKWAAPYALTRPAQHLGLPGLDERSQHLYGEALPARPAAAAANPRPGRRLTTGWRRTTSPQ